MQPRRSSKTDAVIGSVAKSLPIVPRSVLPRLLEKLEAANVAAKVWNDLRSTVLEMLGLDPQVMYGFDWDTGIVRAPQSEIVRQVFSPGPTKPTDEEGAITDEERQILDERAKVVAPTSEPVERGAA